MGRKDVLDVVADIAAFLGPLVIGVLASVWTKDLEELLKGNVAPRSIGFVLLVLLSTIAAGYAVLNRRISERHQKQLQQLSLLVQTSVPELTKVTAQYRETHPDASVRIVLRSLMEAAWEWDARPPGTRYAANVMLFQTERPSSVRFVDDAVATRGFLVLRKTLSTAMDRTPASPDAQLDEFALPVPAPEDRCLPGAPQAFSGGDSDFFADASTLVSWAAKRGFGTAVKEELRDYLASDGSLVRSIFSVALLDQRDGARSPVAVLNFHSSQTRLLGSQGKARDFMRTVQPLLRLLEQELANWQVRDKTRSRGS